MAAIALDLRTLASMKDLRAHMRKVLRQVEDRSGKGIELMRDEEMQVLMMMVVADRRAPNCANKPMGEWT